MSHETKRRQKTECSVKFPFLEHQLVEVASFVSVAAQLPLFLLPSNVPSYPLTSYPAQQRQAPAN